MFEFSRMKDCPSVACGLNAVLARLSVPVLGTVVSRVLVGRVFPVYC